MTSKVYCKIYKWEYVKSTSNISVENILRNGIKKGSKKQKYKFFLQNMLLQRKQQKNMNKKTHQISS